MNNSALVIAMAALVTLTGAVPAAGSTPPPPPPHHFRPQPPPAMKPARVPSWRPPTQPGAHRPEADAQDAHDAQAPQGAAERPLSTDRDTVIRLVNEQRADAGCPLVRAHRALNDAAQKHSLHMARTQRLSHTGSGGSAPGNRVTAAGYSFSSAGENIVAGSKTPDSAVRAWMNSSKHRTSILTCQFSHAGVGRGTGANGPWWTLLLAAPR